MKKLFEKLRGSTYVVQIITLMSGTLMAQLIMLFFIPVITRIYTPGEFGTYTLIFSIINILGMSSSLKYDQAIILPKSDKDAQSLVILSAGITVFIVGLVILFLYVFKEILLSNFEELKNVYWIIPCGVILVGFLQILTAFSSRNQLYKEMSLVRVKNSIVLVTVQYLSKYSIKSGSFFEIIHIFISQLNGLIIGKLLADFFSLLILIRIHIRKETLKLKNISFLRLKDNAKTYVNFPKYQSVTVLLNSISQNIPVLMFASLYSVEVAGFYGLTAKMLQVPVSLIGGSTREVYYQKASKMHAAGESIFELYKKTTLGLLKIFIIPFLVILFFGESIFTFIFGDEWRIAGEISEILILWFLFSFINTPSVATYSIFKLQKVQMKLEVISVMLRLVSIYSGYYLSGSFMLSIKFFLIISVASNLFLMVYIYFKCKDNFYEY